MLTKLLCDRDSLPAGDRAVPDFFAVPEAAITMSALSKTAALLGGTPKLLKLATPAIVNVHSRLVRGGLG